MQFNLSDVFCELQNLIFVKTVARRAHRTGQKVAAGRRTNFLTHNSPADLARSALKFWSRGKEKRCFEVCHVQASSMINPDLNTERAKWNFLRRVTLLWNNKCQERLHNAPARIAGAAKFTGAERKIAKERQQ
jgi:hypothetical protein